MRNGTIDHAGAQVDWAVKLRSKGGVPHSGDGFLLQREGPVVMAAVADGTGSGIVAHEAATACLDALGKLGIAPIDQCFRTVHTAVAGTRGVALGLSLIDLSQRCLDWSAVGDIDAALFRPAPRAECISIIQRGGTLGYQFEGFHRQQHDLSTGDLLLMISDGVSRRFRQSITADHTAVQAVDTCMSRYGGQDDDAIVLALKLRWPA